MDYRRFELAEPASVDRDETADATILKTEASKSCRVRKRNNVELKSSKRLGI